MTAICIILIVILTIVLGFLRLANRLFLVEDCVQKVIEFQKVFKQFLDSNGKDRNAYVTLVKDMDSIQLILDNYGVIHQYRSAFEGTVHHNYQAIINIIPEIDRELSQELISINSLAREGMVSKIRMVEQCNIRYIGEQERLSEKIRKDLRNPFSWFRFGIGSLIESPLGILEYLNIISERTLLNLESSKLYKIITGLTALLTGGAVTLAAIAKFFDKVEIWL